MKILVVCQYYSPEPVRISDICEELVKRGHDITVLTGIPNYPMGNIYSGYEAKKNRIEIINGVKVKRCFTIPRKKNFIMRFFNYHSFSFFSKKYINKLEGEFDVIFVNQLSPVMMANAAIKYKQLYKKNIIMYCLDLWPESLCAGGIKKNSLIYKMYYNISKKIYNKMDRILVTSESFINYFVNDIKIEKNKLKYLPQYAESIFENYNEHEYKDKDENENEKVKDSNITNLLFAGNIGKAQSIETIIEATRILNDKNYKVNIHIVGDGQELERLKNKAKMLKLDNIYFYGRKPLNEMPFYYSKADALIVSLTKDSLISNTLPGKVQSYMAAKKPIIAAANGETKRIIEEAKCGFCSKAEDAKDLSDNIIKFINYAEKKKLGNNSFEYYKQNFDKKIYIDKLIMELERGAKNDYV